MVYSVCKIVLVALLLLCSAFDVPDELCCCVVAFALGVERDDLKIVCDQMVTNQVNDPVGTHLRRHAQTTVRI